MSAAESMPRLLAASLQRTRRLRVQVQGHSMRPLLRTGDWIWIEPVEQAELRCGDIVTMWIDDALLTHRLVAIGDGFLRTKGDSCRNWDAAIGVDLLLGRVAAIERASQVIGMHGPIWQAIHRLAGVSGYIEGWCCAVLDRCFPYAGHLITPVTHLVSFPVRCLLRGLIAKG